MIKVEIIGGRRDGEILEVRENATEVIFMQDKHRAIFSHGDPQPTSEQTIEPIALPIKRLRNGKLGIDGKDLQ